MYYLTRFPRRTKVIINVSKNGKIGLMLTHWLCCGDGSGGSGVGCGVGSGWGGGGDCHVASFRGLEITVRDGSKVMLLIQCR